MFRRCDLKYFATQFLISADAGFYSQCEKNYSGIAKQKIDLTIEVSSINHKKQASNIAYGAIWIKNLSC